jgi:hypothetical protein
MALPSSAGRHWRSRGRSHARCGVAAFDDCTVCSVGASCNHLHRTGEANARPRAAEVRSSRTGTWDTHTLSTLDRLQWVRCSPLHPSAFDIAGTAQHCLVCFSTNWTRYAPLRLGLFRVGSSTERQRAIPTLVAKGGRLIVPIGRPRRAAPSAPAGGRGCGPWGTPWACRATGRFASHAFVRYRTL